MARILVRILSHVGMAIIGIVTGIVLLLLVLEFAGPGTPFQIGAIALVVVLIAGLVFVLFKRRFRWATFFISTLVGVGLLILEFVTVGL